MAPHPTPLTSRARWQVLSVCWTHPQLLPVHTLPSTSGPPRQPRAQLRFASPTQGPGGSYWGPSDHLTLSLPLWLPAACVVKKALDADLASRGLQRPVSADGCILKAHPLPGRTSRSQRAYSSPICKVHRHKGERYLSLPGPGLSFYMHSLTEFPPVTYKQKMLFPFHRRGD